MKDAFPSFNMIEIWLYAFHIFLLIPIRSETTYVTGIVGQPVMQVAFVLQDVQTCLENREQFSLLDSSNNQFRCINQHLLYCLLRGDQRSERRSFHPIYCGVISSVDHEVHLSDAIMFIRVIKGHILYHEILRFNFELTRAISCDNHGLVFVHKVHRSESYCGRRVPWTIIMSSDKSYVHLKIISHLQYELSIFYSSFKKEWITRFSHVKMMNIRNGEMKFFEPKIISAQYYFITNHSKHIYLNMLSTGPVNGSVIVKDGPGRFSNTLLDISNTLSPSNVSVRTSAYIAFIEISMLYNTYPLIKIKVKVATVVGKAPQCFQQSGRIYFSDTSTYRRNVVCSSKIRPSIRVIYIGLFVKTFMFHGPNKLTDVISSVCQYGGLSLRFSYADEAYVICETITDLYIDSQQKTLLVTLVWFYGYSEGHMEGYYQTHHCQTFYLDRNPRNIIYQRNVFFEIDKHDEHAECYVVVCPALLTNVQAFCTIHVGPHSVGTTRLEIIERDTLQPCDVQLKNGFTSYTINASFTENWPFGLMNGTTTSYERFSTPQIHTYDFLQFATAQLSLLCNSKSPRKQLAIHLKISHCQVIENEIIMNAVANGIPALSDSCPMIVYTFIATRGDINKYAATEEYHDFIYGSDGYISTGHEVKVEYTACPEQCKNYNFSVFVRSTDNQTIVEYTAQVGVLIFTGNYHRGFRIKIIMPETDCITKLCYMKVSAYNSPIIGTEAYAPDKVAFYTKR